MTSRLRQRDPQWWMETALFLLYALLVGVASSKHIFWRDEAQAWLIARDSSSIFNLIHNVRHEAHPPLWHLILFGITRFTKNPEWMKLPNLLCALVTAYLLLRARRVPLTLRAGCTFSYFILFEYAVLDRNYMIGIMLLVAAALCIGRKERVFRVPLLLSLAALTSLSALLVAACMYLLHLVTNAPKSNTPLRLATFLPRGRRWLAGVMFALSTVVSLAIILPPIEGPVELHPVLHGLTMGGPRQALVLHGLMLAYGYVPIPQVTGKFWDTHWGLTQPAWVAGCGWTLFVFCLFVPHSRHVRWFFAVASALLLLELRMSGGMTERGTGWLFVCFILALLLDASITHDDRDVVVAQSSLWQKAVVWPLLTVQVAVGLFFISRSLRRPFSSSKDVAQFLRRQHLHDAPMIIEPDFEGAAVLAYLQNRSAYYVEIQREGSFVVWNGERRNRSHVPTRSDVNAAAKDGVPPVLLVDTPLTDEEIRKLGVKLIAAYSEGLCAYDRYFLYRTAPGQ